MCGRYSIATDSFSLHAQLDLELANEVAVPNYNASPSNHLPLIINEAPKLIHKGKWGFVTDWGGQAESKGLVINARQETVAQKKMFAPLANTNRCLILADGFFEWQKNGKAKQPFRFTLKSEELFSFAGLFKLAQIHPGLKEISFVILTTQANSIVGELHERMPVILDRQRQEQWLSLPWNDLDEVFKPYPAEQMKSYKVTPRINWVGYNLKDAIIPWQDPYLSLF